MNQSPNNCYYAHPSSIIETPTTIGNGTSIWHFSHVMQNVRIGTNCNIGQNVFIGESVNIGNNVKIQNNVSVYSGVTLEDDVFCGPSCVFTNVNIPRSHLSQRGQYVTTLVKKGASLGANSTVVCGHTIGGYAFIGAGSVVTSDIPANAFAYGNPARLHGWICECGTKLVFNDANTYCTNCNSKYLLNDFNRDQQIEHISDD
jgi:UDP-2-acetamido-3-amino-2,3-dideoxy-glucuronate N-acetyltransferase